MEQIQITINGKNFQVNAGSTILEAARSNNIHIPTLCNLEKLDPRANCRICVVEVEGMRTLQPACATKVREGMVISTDSPLVRKNRKRTLELILSSHAVDCHHCLRIGSSKCADLDPVFCEMCFFCDCVKDGFCELQALAREYEVDLLPYEMHPYDYEEDTSLGSVIRNPNKCIKCRRCVDVCGEIQTVHTLSMQKRGREIQVVPELGKQMKDSPCVRCGRCVTVCPTGAVYMKEHKDELVYDAHRYGITTAALISGNVLRELEQLFHMEEGKLTSEKVAEGLKKIGVDVVGDDKVGMALAQAEGSTAVKECLDRQNIAILVNSFAAKNFIKRYYPEMEDRVVSYPSEQQAFASYIKGTYGQTHGIKSENIRVFSVSNDNENGAEACEKGGVDISVNARELYRIFLRTGVDLRKRDGVALDAFSEISACEIHPLFAHLDWNMEREPEHMEMSFEGKKRNVWFAHNLGQARKLLEQIKEGKLVDGIIRIQA